MTKIKKVKGYYQKRKNGVKWLINPHTRGRRRTKKEMIMAKKIQQARDRGEIK